MISFWSNIDKKEKEDFIKFLYQLIDKASINLEIRKKILKRSVIIFNHLPSSSNIGNLKIIFREINKLEKGEIDISGDTVLIKLHKDMSNEIEKKKKKDFLIFFVITI